MVGVAVLGSSSSASAQALALKLTDLDSPTFVTSWPGNADVLVVAQRGSAKVTVHDMTSVPPGLTGTLLDLSGGHPGTTQKAFIPVNAHGDFRGLTGLAFHPEFLTDTSKRYIYVRYNAHASPPAPDMVIERYYIRPGTNYVVYTSAATVYTHSFVDAAHASGQIHFDTDGTNTLYAAMPDDSNGDCVLSERAQLDPAHLGKLLSFDVDSFSPPTEVVPTLLAKGLRNPFGFSVDRGDATGAGKGDVWIGNTGDQCAGDIFHFPAGTTSYPNYAWPWREGDCNLADGLPPLFVLHNPCGAGEPTSIPTYTLPHRVVSKSLTAGQNDALIGGYVYRGTGVGGLPGKYVYALHLAPRVHSIDPSDNMAATVDLSPSLGLNTWASGSLHGLGQDADGELYVMRVNVTIPLVDNGKIYKIE